MATLEQNLDFSIYPNPSSDVLQFENKSGSDLRINIYSLTGRLIYKDIQVKEGALGTINIESLHSGMYFLKSFSESTQKYQTTSFVKK